MCFVDRPAGEDTLWGQRTTRLGSYKSGLLNGFNLPAALTATNGYTGSITAPDSPVFNLEFNLKMDVLGDAAKEAIYQTRQMGGSTVAVMVGDRNVDMLGNNSGEHGATLLPAGFLDTAAPGNADTLATGIASFSGGSDPTSALSSNDHPQLTSIGSNKFGSIMASSARWKQYTRLGSN
jgi:hypothetical protein